MSDAGMGVATGGWWVHVPPSSEFWGGVPPEITIFKKKNLEYMPKILDFLVFPK